VFISCVFLSDGEAFVAVVAVVAVVDAGLCVCVEAAVSCTFFCVRVSLFFRLFHSVFDLTKQLGFIFHTMAAASSVLAASFIFLCVQFFSAIEFE